MLCRMFRRYQCAFAALLLLQGHAAAVVLKWDSVAWTAGSTDNSYQADVADPDSGVRIQVTPNNGAPFADYSGTPGLQTPAVNAAFQGDLASTHNTLTIAVDLANLSQTVTVTVSFAASGGASNVSFKLFDIDAGGGAQDELTSIQATLVGGGTVDANITPGASNTLISPGPGQIVRGTTGSASTGPGSAGGTVAINFGTNLIQSFTFTFGSFAFANPTYQHFGIADINFTPVPEANPAVLSALSCLAAVGLVWRHRFKARK